MQMYKILNPIDHIEKAGLKKIFCKFRMLELLFKNTQKKLSLRQNFKYLESQESKTRSLIVMDIKARGLQGCNVTLMDQEEIDQIGGMLIEE